MMDDIMIAYRLNGVPLPFGHGFPARRIVPGHYGMKHVQWRTGIELISSDYIDYDQPKDWSDEGIVKTKSWIMDPQPETPKPLERNSSCRTLPLRDARGFIGWTSSQTEEKPRPLHVHVLPYSVVMWRYPKE